MCDNGDPEDKPPAPPVRMSSTIFSTGSGKDSLSANHSSKPLPSVPEERKPRNKIISIFSGAEKSMKITVSQGCHHVWYQCWLHWFMIRLLCKYTNIFVLSQVVGRKIGIKNDRRFRRLQTLNTPYMLALTPSRGSSLWVPSVCYWSLGHQPKHPSVRPNAVSAQGMPEQWARLLQTSNITKSEQKKNPQAVLDVLKFYDSTGNGRQKYLSFSSSGEALNSIC